METTRTTNLDSRIGNLVETTHAEPERPFEAGSEWSARPLRPVAHWVQMPRAGGRNGLEMVWEVPNPMPSDATA